MERNESKAPLVLMEQVIMVLVFALVSAVCIQAFALARTTSIRMSDRDHAMNISQTLAETVKAYSGNMEAVCGSLGGEIEGEQLVFYYDSGWESVSKSADASFRAVFAQEEQDGFCRYGQITVSDTAEDQEIFSMRVAWQGAEANE